MACQAGPKFEWPHGHAYLVCLYPGISKRRFVASSRVALFITTFMWTMDLFSLAAAVAVKLKYWVYFPLDLKTNQSLYIRLLLMAIACQLVTVQVVCVFFNTRHTTNPSWKNSALMPCHRISFALNFVPTSFCSLVSFFY